MEFDAFTGGVEPGGLRTRNDIKILVCYMLATLNAPFAGDDLVRVLQENSLANYFEVTDAIASLEALQNIEAVEGGYRVTDSGRAIAESLYISLPLSVREKAMQAAMRLRAEAKVAHENPVEIVHIEEGYQVVCHVSGGSLELMQFTLYVPDLYQARMVKRNFHRDPEGFYRLLLAAATGNRDLAAEVFDTLSPAPR